MQLFQQFVAEPVGEHLQFVQAELACGLADQRGVEVAEQRFEALFLAGEDHRVELLGARRLGQATSQDLDLAQLLAGVAGQAGQFRTGIGGDCRQPQALLQRRQLPAQRPPLALQVAGAEEGGQAAVVVGLAVLAQEAPQAAAPQQAQRVEPSQPGACLEHLAGVGLEAFEVVLFEHGEGRRQQRRMPFEVELAQLPFDLLGLRHQAVATARLPWRGVAEQRQPVGQALALLLAQIQQGTDLACQPGAVGRRVVDLEARRVFVEGFLPGVLRFAEGAQAVGEGLQGGLVGGEGAQLRQRAALIVGR